MTEAQKVFLECYKISAEFCGRTNSGHDKLTYNHNDLHNIAIQIANKINGVT